MLCYKILVFMVEIIILLLFYTAEDANIENMVFVILFNFLYFNILSEEGGFEPEYSLEENLKMPLSSCKSNHVDLKHFSL